MNEKENALRTVQFDHPERVASWPPFHYVHYHECNHRGFDEGPTQLAHSNPVGAQWVDIWETKWHKLQPGNVMGLPIGNPLSEVASLKHYRWPDPHEQRICGSIYEMAESFADAYEFLTGDHRDTLWEKSYMLVGMENIMTYILAEPEFAREVFHRMMDFQLGIAEHCLDVGVELVLFCDDLGTQRGPLLGTQTVQAFLVPECRRLFRLYKDNGVLIGFHSCDKIEAFVGMFINLGVDILNPVQATANDLDKVRSLTQGRMALQGAVSSATVMDGPPNRIVREVRERIWQLGQNGGYFCSPDQGLPFPDEHREALNNAIAEYGQYPLEPLHM